MWENLEEIVCVLLNRFFFLYWESCVNFVILIIWYFVGVEFDFFFFCSEIKVVSSFYCGYVEWNYSYESCFNKLVFDCFENSLVWGMYVNLYRVVLICVIVFIYN